MLFVSAGDDKAMAYAGVPQDLSKQLPAGGLHLGVAVAAAAKGCCGTPASCPARLMLTRSVHPSNTITWWHNLPSDHPHPNG